MSTAKKITTSERDSVTSSSKNSKLLHTFNWRVLIVEDEPAIAEGIKNIIAPPANVVPLHRSSRSRANSSVSFNAENSNTGEVRKDQFDVTWAKNPKEALDLVQKSIKENKPFAMGFFDVLLGAEIDGIELVRQIHQIDPDIYSVFVTAYHDRTVDSINQILGQNKADRWDYMNKPFTDGAILQKARNAVSTWNLRAEKKLHENQLAEAANLFLQGERASSVAAVGRSVAHEFGNILMHIIGNAEIALMKNDTTSMHTSLKTILKAGETATSILDKFKKIQTGENKPEFSNVNLNDCLNEAVDLMAHELKKRNIKVTRIKFENCSVNANYHSLVQVFINALINACHAMPNSGQIDLSILSVTQPMPDGKIDGPYCEILIRDHGPGIPEDILPKVMDPFYTTKGKKGTGLGLPICREIVEGEHSGEFKLSNHPSKGIQVTIRLPVTQEESNADE